MDELWSICWPVADCPDCHKPVSVEYVDVDVGYVWHGVCCGWGRVFPEDAIYDLSSLDWSSTVE